MWFRVHGGLGTLGTLGYPPGSAVAMASTKALLSLKIPALCTASAPPSAPFSAPSAPPPHRPPHRPPQVRLVLAQKLLKNLKMGVRPAMHLPCTRCFASLCTLHCALGALCQAQDSAPRRTRRPLHRAVCQPAPAGATKAAHARASSGGGVPRGVTAQSCYYVHGL